MKRWYCLSYLSTTRRRRSNRRGASALSIYLSCHPSVSSVCSALLYDHRLCPFFAFKEMFANSLFVCHSDLDNCQIIISFVLLWVLLLSVFANQQKVSPRHFNASQYSKLKRRPISPRPRRHDKLMACANKRVADGELSVWWETFNWDAPEDNRTDTSTATECRTHLNLHRERL